VFPSTIDLARSVVSELKRTLQADSAVMALKAVDDINTCVQTIEMFVCSEHFTRAQALISEQELLSVLATLDSDVPLPSTKQHVQINNAINAPPPPPPPPTTTDTTTNTSNSNANTSTLSPQTHQQVELILVETPDYCEIQSVSPRVVSGLGVLLQTTFARLDAQKYRDQQLQQLQSQLQTTKSQLTTAEKRWQQTRDKLEEMSQLRVREYEAAMDLRAINSELEQRLNKQTLRTEKSRRLVELQMPSAT
jgi:hypothetical protein